MASIVDPDPDGKIDARPGFDAFAAVMRVAALHASDNAETPFCTECGHCWPCWTIRTIDGDV